MTNRRDFLIAGLAGLSAGAQEPAAETAGDTKTIGIQVGAVSFVDEGTGKVLDIFQERAAINTLFLATFTYGRGIAGRQVPGRPLPDHGKQEYTSITTAATTAPYTRNTTRSRVCSPRPHARPIMGTSTSSPKLHPRRRSAACKSFCGPRIGPGTR